jgi:hypothetical protein
MPGASRLADLPRHAELLAVVQRRDAGQRQTEGGAETLRAGPFADRRREAGHVVIL